VTKGVAMIKQSGLFLSLLEIILVLALVLGIVVLVSNQMGGKAKEIKADEKAEQAPWKERLGEVETLKQEQIERQEKALRDALGSKEPAQPDTVRRMDLQDRIKQFTSPPGRKSNPALPSGNGANQD
jgi:hypothetical protein